MEMFDVNISSSTRDISSRVKSGIVPEILVHWINELADEVERKAKEFAPEGETGRLKSIGVLKLPAQISQITGTGGRPGEIVTNIPAFGGGHTVRGAGGRFVSVSKIHDPGFVFTGTFSFADVTAQVLLNPELPYAKWVHNGTGIYGPMRRPYTPRTKPFMVFWWHGRKWFKRTVKGQRPQPFLTEAYDYVNDVYAPVRLSQLRAELDAIT